LRYKPVFGLFVPRNFRRRLRRRELRIAVKVIPKFGDGNSVTDY
jgi:hypothetical protein